MTERFVAATTAGGLDDEVSAVFGRTPTFTVVTVQDGQIVDVEVVPNPAGAAASGAGIQAAQFVASYSPRAVFAGNFGPNVAGLFAQAGIEMVPAPGMTVRQAVEQYLKGALTSSPGGYAGGYGPGYGPGRGMGMGMGRGRGYGGMGWGGWGAAPGAWGAPPPPPPPPPPGGPGGAEDSNQLRERLSRLESELSEIKRKLEELGGE